MRGRWWQVVQEMVWQQWLLPCWQLHQLLLLQGAAREAAERCLLLGVLQPHPQARMLHLATSEGTEYD
jgi:hypothetical protein